MEKANKKENVKVMDETNEALPQLPSYNPEDEPNGKVFTLFKRLIQKSLKFGPFKLFKPYYQASFEAFLKKANFEFLKDKTNEIPFNH